MFYSFCLFYCGQVDSNNLVRYCHFNWLNKNKIHSDHFPIELISRETQFRVSFDFYSIGKLSE